LPRRATPGRAWPERGAVRRRCREAREAVRRLWPVSRVHGAFVAGVAHGGPTADLAHSALFLVGLPPLKKQSLNLASSFIERQPICRRPLRTQGMACTPQHKATAFV
jgi:hypothetical protein